MKKYNNILVVAEPKKDVQVALKRALDITQFNPKATITFLRVVYDYSYDLIILNKVKEKPVHDDIEQTYIDHLEKIIEEYDVRSGQGPITIARSMSGGNQQKAIIAREIETQADLMIFVQPTRGLDIGAIENIHKQIIGERDKGKAILLISLELDEVMNLADTIGVIYNGSINKIADAKSLTANEVGEFMMGVGHNE